MVTDEQIDDTVAKCMAHWMIAEVGDVGGQHQAYAHIENGVLVCDLLAIIRDLRARTEVTA